MKEEKYDDGMIKTSKISTTFHNNNNKNNQNYYYQTNLNMSQYHNTNNNNDYDINNKVNNENEMNIKNKTIILAKSQLKNNIKQIKFNQQCSLGTSNNNKNSKMNINNNSSLYTFKDKNTENNDNKHKQHLRSNLKDFSNNFNHLDNEFKEEEKSIFCIENEEFMNYDNNGNLLNPLISNYNKNQNKNQYNNKFNDLSNQSELNISSSADFNKKNNKSKLNKNENNEEENYYNCKNTINLAEYRNKIKQSNAFTTSKCKSINFNKNHTNNNSSNNYNATISIINHTNNYKTDFLLNNNSSKSIINDNNYNNNLNNKSNTNKLANYPSFHRKIISCNFTEFKQKLGNASSRKQATNIYSNTKTTIQDNNLYYEKSNIVINDKDLPVFNSTNNTSNGFVLKRKNRSVNMTNCNNYNTLYSIKTESNIKEKSKEELNDKKKISIKSSNYPLIYRAINIENTNKSLQCNTISDCNDFKKENNKKVILSIIKNRFNNKNYKLNTFRAKSHNFNGNLNVNYNENEDYYQNDNISSYTEYHNNNINNNNFHDISNNNPYYQTMNNINSNRIHNKNNNKYKLENNNKQSNKSYTKREINYLKTIYDKPMTFRDSKNKNYKFSQNDFEVLNENKIIENSDLVEYKVLKTQRKVWFMKGILECIYPNLMKNRTELIKTGKASKLELSKIKKKFIE